MRRMKQRPRFYGSKTMVRRFQEIYLYFFLYCVIGWLYEVFLEVVVYRWGFSNRGVLFGPYLPIYGIGALVFLLCFGRYVQKPAKGARRWLQVGLVFLGCMTVATAIELAATYWMEYTVGSWPWQTYVDYGIQFQGRIALSPSIRFGLGGLVFLFLLQPLLERATDALPEKGRVVLPQIVTVWLLADLCLTVVL